ncbi:MULTISPECIES: hypothetical protein [Aquitalea]|uniref:hypothetical protein n=1 Tax=Aquitalea TaxID=407217 RepID=UPI0011B77F0D|nr:MULTISPECIES: hypothetical protein [Aquitalea]
MMLFKNTRMSFPACKPGNVHSDLDDWPPQRRALHRMFVPMLSWPTCFAGATFAAIVASAGADSGYTEWVDSGITCSKGV